ncbi:MAG: M16 family metallopeptidase [Vicinamibacterales bacterium]
MALTPTRIALPGGATLIVQENRTTPSVSLVAGVTAGAAVDPAGREGTAALTARVLDRGTALRPAGAIADALDGRGASLSTAAGRHQAVVSATCLADDVDEVFDLLVDVLCHPVFPDREVATRRTELVTGIRQDADDPGAVAEDRLAALLYPGHPYGRRVSGTVASVEGLGRADLEAFHAAWFGPDRTTIVVAGAVEASRVADRAGALMAAWRPAAGVLPAWPRVAAAPARRVESVAMPGKAQSDVAYGFVGLRRDDPDHDQAMVMNNALGQYALGGRLGDSIRERQGMAYYVYSELDASLAEGPLQIRAGVSAANVEKTIASIDRELDAIRAEGFTAKEIDESKRYLVGSLPRQLETNRAIAGFLLRAELFGLGLDYDQRLPGLLAAVTRDQANAAAARLLDPARATIVVAGPPMDAAQATGATGHR